MSVVLHARGDHCLAPERVDAPSGEGSRYGLMFDLPPLVADEGLLHELGAAGGFCDGGDCKDDARVEAGWPFFGQYVAHDLTADRSPLRARTDRDALRNMRSPRANLEPLYAGGPTGAPYLYSRADPSKLLENEGDLPRNQEGVALIGDPRNDVHVFMSQLQVGFIRAHNLLVDRLREDGFADADLFDEARRALTWHYQWLIVNEFLPVLVGSDLVDEIVETGARFYHPDGTPFIPLEFADAAYRYGHSQIRQLYQLQPHGPLHPVFPDLIGFGPVGDHQRRLVAAVRRRGPTPRAARQTDRRSPTALADRAAAGGHRPGRRRGLPVARSARPRARTGNRAPIRRSGRPADRRRRAERGRARPPTVTAGTARRRSGSTSSSSRPHATTATGSARWAAASSRKF